MANIPIGSHPDRPVTAKDLSAKAELALTESIGEGGTNDFTHPHVIKVSGVDGCYFWGISTAPRFIADGSGIYPILQELGFPKVFYTAAARDKILQLFA